MSGSQIKKLYRLHRRQQVNGKKFKTDLWERLALPDFAVNLLVGIGGIILGLAFQSSFVAVLGGIMAFAYLVALLVTCDVFAETEKVPRLSVYWLVRFWQVIRWIGTYLQSPNPAEPGVILGALSGLTASVVEPQQRCLEKISKLLEQRQGDLGLVQRLIRDLLGQEAAADSADRREIADQRIKDATNLSELIVGQIMHLKAQSQRVAEEVGEYKKAVDGLERLYQAADATQKLAGLQKRSRSATREIAALDREVGILLGKAFAARRTIQEIDIDTRHLQSARMEMGMHPDRPEIVGDIRLNG